MEDKKQLLLDYFLASGKTKTFLADKINVSRPRLDAIFDNPMSATVSQADGLCKEFGIKKNDRDFIFLP